MIYQDFPGPGMLKKKIQDFPGGVGTLLNDQKHYTFKINFRFASPHLRSD